MTPKLQPEVLTGLHEHPSKQRSKIGGLPVTRLTVFIYLSSNTSFRA
jgi:hypothetical protein